MKKSTLITTIAMIVVVVVALSTATYAWFNTATTNVIESEMTTQASEGWLLYAGNVSSRSGATATITYNETDPIVLNMMKGVYSPDTATALNAELENAEGNNLSATFVETKFYKALQSGKGIQSIATLENGEADSKYTHTVVSNETSTEVDNLNCIHVINNNASAAHCMLSILVSVGTNPQTKDYLAGQQFSTYIATSNGGKFNTAYYYGATATVDSVTTATRVSNAATVSQTTGDTPTDSVVYSTGAGSQTVKTATTAGNGYSTAAVASKFGTTSIPANTKYYIITIDLGSVDAYGIMNLVFYAWFDGWALDSTASNATVKVNYSFGSSALDVETA